MLFLTFRFQIRFRGCKCDQSCDQRCQSADQKDHSCQTEGAGVALFMQSDETGEHPEQSDDPHASHHIKGFDEYGGIKQSDQRRRQKGKKLDGRGILFPGIAVGSGKKIPQKVHQSGAVGDE